MPIDGRRLASCLLAAWACACSPEPQPDKGGIAIGLLLPFTGSASATASNLERATLFAVDRINEAGGVNGTRMRVVSRDTHSDIARGVQAAKELADQGVVAVIGPESADIAEEIRPLLAERDVLFLSPLVGAAAEPSRSCETAWFRLAPSAKALGEALAKRAIAAGIRRVAILHSSSPYDRALGAAAKTRFAQLGGMVALVLELNPKDQSYADEVRAAINFNVTDVILAASPRAAAIVVNEFDALSSKKPTWLLSPLLKTDLLVQNVAPQALEGALGVAPRIDPGGQFPAAFSARWLGDQPLEGAYFYYDAVVLFAVALAKATYAEEDATDPPPPGSLGAAMVDASRAPGEVMSWDELEVGLSRLANGEDLYYTGLTGSLPLEKCGSRSIGITSNWTVTDGVIADGD